MSCTLYTTNQFYVIETYNDDLQQEMALSELSSAESGGETDTLEKHKRKQKRSNLSAIREISVSPPPSLDLNSEGNIIILYQSQYTKN